MATEDTTTLIDRICDTGTELVAKFYKYIDKRRHDIATLYSDNADAIWNGNLLNGNNNISKFYQELPTSTHTICSVDCQPVGDDDTGYYNTGGEVGVLVCCEGVVQFEGMPAQNFSQTFVLHKQLDSIWKIQHDCFRYFE